METLREGWAEYEGAILRQDANEGAREAMQHAFYHGALALIAIGEGCRKRGVTENERQAVLSRIVDDIGEFEAQCEMKMLLHMLVGSLR